MPARTGTMVRRGGRTEPGPPSPVSFSALAHLEKWIEKSITPFANSVLSISDRITVKPSIIHTEMAYTWLQEQGLKDLCYDHEDIAYKFIIRLLSIARVN